MLRRAGPPETQTILRYQCEEVLIPYWRELVAYARGRGFEAVLLDRRFAARPVGVTTVFASKNGGSS
jgi:preprotein translocase subunit SecB